ncbi:MAG: PAS domain-containing protein [Caulobacterales bacterium]|jgi:PAS domain S-box-containing protein|nr:PAS domain-containing protein [Caulobacterales bacterium]
MISSLPFEVLRQVLEALPVRIFWKDRESRYLGCNQLFAEDAGIADPRHFVGKTDFYFFPFHQADGYRFVDAEVMVTGEAMTIEEQITMPDGQVRWVQTHKMPLRDAKGAVIGLIGLYHHITEERRSMGRARLEALASGLQLGHMA